MTSTDQTFRRHPAAWVPTLYFAEGVPFYVVNYMALFFYQDMGVSNAVITFVVSLLAWPWTLKPIWSPLLEMYKTKKFFVVLLQFVGGLSLVVLALSLNVPGYFRYSVAVLGVLGFCSATHDIAADGIYIASLSPKEQAAYVGWQGAFYNVARIFSMGALLWLIGVLGERFAAAHMALPTVRAWMLVFAGLGFLLVGLSAYHARMLPAGGEERDAVAVEQGLRASHSVAGMGPVRRRLVEGYERVARSQFAKLPAEDGATRRLRLRLMGFLDVLVTFFLKPGIILLLIFIFLYRAGEGQVIKVGPLFLRADRLTGGLGLTKQQVGFIYGTFGSACFILGSVLGGYFTARLGLKRALTWLILILNLPMLAYWYLSVALPTNPVLITVAMCVEMFGYGFGFVGVILLMMQEIAPGKYQTAHYAFANALMNLGVILPGAVSGWIQTKLGYRHFFIWVLIAAIPALILSRFIPIRGGVAEPAAVQGAGAGE
jgi:PAT family beta-lactamase induction signal transducer AmpG